LSANTFKLVNGSFIKPIAGHNFLITQAIQMHHSLPKSPAFPSALSIHKKYGGHFV
jgi:hypothetical protein